MARNSVCGRGTEARACSAPAGRDGCRGTRKERQAGPLVWVLGGWQQGATRGSCLEPPLHAGPRRLLPGQFWGPRPTPSTCFCPSPRTQSGLLPFRGLSSTLLPLERSPQT